jgi:hypothetical protein
MHTFSIVNEIAGASSTPRVGNTAISLDERLNAPLSPRSQGLTPNFFCGRGKKFIVWYACVWHDLRDITTPLHPIIRLEWPR